MTGGAGRGVTLEAVRGARWLLLLALGVTLASSSGCTVLLWSWAMKPRIESELLGVQREQRGQDLVVYRLDQDSGRAAGYYAFRVPHGWDDGPVTRVTRTDGVETLQFDAHLTLESLADQGRPDLDRLRRVEVLSSRRDLGKTRIEFSRADDWYYEYRVIPRVDSRGMVSHQLWGYSPEHRAWALLGEADVGEAHYEILVAAFLTPLTVVADAAGGFLYLLVLFAADSGH